MLLTWLEKGQQEGAHAVYAKEQPWASYLGQTLLLQLFVCNLETATANQIPLCPAHLFPLLWQELRLNASTKS